MCWGSIEGNFQKNLTDIRIAIAGDLHGSWSQDDLDLLLELNPDGVLFVGDLSDGDLLDRATTDDGNLKPEARDALAELYGHDHGHEDHSEDGEY